MNIDADFRYAWLETQYNAAVAASTTLLARLQSQSSSSISGISSAGALKAASGNGKSMEVFGASESGIKASDLGALNGFMLRLYRTVRAVLISSGVAAPTDAQIYTEMLARPELAPIVEVEASYAGMCR